MFIRDPPGGSPGLSFLSNPVAGQNVALYAVPAFRASNYLVSAFLAHHLHFPHKLLRSLTVDG